LVGAVEEVLDAPTPRRRFERCATRAKAFGYNWIVKITLLISSRLKQRLPTSIPTQASICESKVQLS